MDSQNQANNTPVTGSNPVFPPSNSNPVTQVNDNSTNVTNDTAPVAPVANDAIASQALEEASKVLETEPLANISNPVNPEPQPQMYTDLPTLESSSEPKEGMDPVIPQVNMQSDISNANVTQMDGGVKEFNNANEVQQLNPTPVVNEVVPATMPETNVNEAPMLETPVVETPVVNETMVTPEAPTPELPSVMSENTQTSESLPELGNSNMTGSDNLLNQENNIPSEPQPNLLPNTPMATNTQPEPAKEEKPVDTTGKKKILVVDDEPDAKDLFAELLRTNSGYVVDTASDGNEALEKCTATKYDLMLLDIVMPNLDGVGTLSELKSHPEKYGDPVVIMLTNIGGDIAIQEALKLGAVGYKLKIDTEPEELMQTVQKALDAKSSNSLTSQPSQSAL